MTSTMWPNILWFLSIATVVGTVVTAARPKCIGNGLNCWYATIPCCRRQYLKNGQHLRDEFICWEFGGGICTEVHKIPNLERYLNLTQDINSTNYAERYHLYWEEVGQNRSDAWLENRTRSLRQREAEIYATSKPSNGNGTSFFPIIIISMIFFPIIIYTLCPDCFKKDVYPIRRTRVRSGNEEPDNERPELNTITVL